MAGIALIGILTVLYLPGLYALWFRKSLDDSIAKPDAGEKAVSHEETQAALSMAAE